MASSVPMETQTFLHCNQCPTKRYVSPSYFFIICLDYVLRTLIDLMKETGFTLTKERSRRYQTNDYGQGLRW